MNEKILKTVKELKERSEKRNFSQTFDMIVHLKEFDLKKPENKFVEDIFLPHGKGKDVKIVLFSDTLKVDGLGMMTNADLQNLAKNKREAKKLVSSTDFFLAEAKLMPQIGKVLGPYIGPRGKMPKIIGGNINEMVKNYLKSVRIRIKDSAIIQCPVGIETMGEEKIAENVEAVLKFLESRLPKGKNNIGKVLLKLTMSKPIKLEV